MHWHTYQTTILQCLKAGKKGFLEHYHKSGYALSNESVLLSERFVTPTLMFLGKNDNIVGYEQQIEFAKQFSNINAVISEIAEHNFMIDDWSGFGSGVRGLGEEWFVG
jgi:hypothetical protein